MQKAPSNRQRQEDTPVVAPMRREVVVAREMQAEKAQASLNSPGTTEAACWSASRCAKDPIG
ncbi:MAG: hypothetical protein FRX49_00821 [Trebouxia sp. A1-2]|nr:MAG: hypothetical protein FRX49_00821 [Trebouxia sp. A1-2]